MSITEQTTSLPTGTYGVDRVHSSVAFGVQYMGIGTFGGTVSDFDATLDGGRLTGAARIATLEVKDENLHAHLLSPEFFDAERYPEVSFSTDAGASSAAVWSSSALCEPARRLPEMARIFIVTPPSPVRGRP